MWEVSEQRALVGQAHHRQSIANRYQEAELEHVRDPDQLLRSVNLAAKQFRARDSTAWPPRAEVNTTQIALRWTAAGHRSQTTGPLRIHGQSLGARTMLAHALGV